MSKRESPYLAYSEERLESAAQEAAFRVVLTERNFQRVLAKQQQAEAATLRVRRLRDRARGDLRLIAALLEEKETFFEEEGGTAETHGEEEELRDSVYTLLRSELSPPSSDSPPGSAPLPRLSRGQR